MGAGQELIASGIGGSLPQWLIFVGMIVTALVFYRGGGGSAISNLQAANRVLERELHKTQTALQAALSKIASLEVRTDFAVQLQPIRAWQLQHEEHEAERHQQTLKVLELIAAWLGPEENGPQAGNEPTPPSTPRRHRPEDQ